MSERQVEVCREVARQILGHSRAFFPFFVLHDFTHSENVCRNLHELPGLLGGGITRVDLNLLYMAAYLHDIGMALPPLIIDEMNINVGSILKDVKEEYRDKMRHKIACFSGFIENGYVRLNKNLKKCDCTDMKAEDSSSEGEERAARLVRLLHPWISSSFIRNHLRHELGVELPPEIEHLCKRHNSKTSIPSADDRLRKLTIALRLADAMDFSWARGKYFFRIAWRQYVTKVTDQLKHWAFKLSIEEVRVREGGLQVEVSEDADRASVLGVLLFEVANNFYEDWSEIAGCGLRIPLWIRRGSVRVEVTGIIDALNKAHARVASSDEFERICGLLEEVGSSNLRVTVGALRAAHRKWREDERKCAPEVSTFDALALAIAARIDVDDAVDRILEDHIDSRLRDTILNLL